MARAFGSRIKLRPSTLGLFWLRTSVFTSVRRWEPLLGGVLVDIGCGRMPYRDHIMAHSKVHKYIGLDFPDGAYAVAREPDLTWDGTTMPLDDASVNCALATEVLEHCPDPDAMLSEVCRVLKPGGVFVFTVPFLWPLHDEPYDFFRYTPYALERLLSKAGFIDIELQPLGGWDASLAQMLGLWVRRRPMAGWKRLMLSLLVLPVVKTLVWKDQNQTTHFREGLMFTGLSGTARKPRQEALMT